MGVVPSGFSEPSMQHRSNPSRIAARGLAALLFAGCATLGCGSPRAQSSETAPAVVMVSVDNAKVIRLPEKTQTVIVGNPIIADVALQKNGVLILTGKSFGSTNLIALDASGNMLAESTISVQAPQAAVITVQRGLDRESYSCTPNCQPSIQLGDASKYYGDVSGQAESRRSMATGSGASSGAK
jgi:Flp pilus assembly secretin CpaC